MLNQRIKKYETCHTLRDDRVSLFLQWTGRTDCLPSRRNHLRNTLFAHTIADACAAPVCPDQPSKSAVSARLRQQTFAPRKPPVARSVFAERSSCPQRELSPKRPPQSGVSARLGSRGWMRPHGRGWNREMVRSLPGTAATFCRGCT